MIVVQLIFWLSVVAIFHSYVFYPLLLKLLAATKKANDICYQKNETLPEISFIIAAYNEENIIGKKLESILASGYPADKMEILVGSDASTDRTDEIIREYGKHHINIFLKAYNERRGKAAIINDLKKTASNPIVILTDANVIFGSDAIFHLISHFKNEEIALVGANIVNTGLMNAGISYQEKTYIERENAIKYREGLIWGAMAGAFGACYAIRKNLIPEIPSNFLVEDFYITMHIIKNGKKAVNEPAAVCHEDVSTELKEELRRKIRISAGNFQNLSVFFPMLWRIHTGAGFSFFSHKIIRWFGPLLLIAAYLSSLLLSGYHILFFYLFAAQTVLLLMPVFDALMAYLFKVQIPLLRFITYFYAMNLALLIGMFRFLSGVKSVAWRPTKRIIQNE